MKKYTVFLIGFLFLFSACDENNTPSLWSIPENEVRDGGPGKDGIPSIDNPTFITAAEATYLEDSNLVIGYVLGGEARAYPHPILDWHEIINDEINGEAIAITYCPLTGTGIGWNRTINGKTTTFGVSGLLYNSNLIPYDRETDSNWSQMRLAAVNGTLKDTIIETFPIVETTWASWKTMYPNTKVVSDNTGFSRNYDVYPYGNYKTTNALYFPVSNSDETLRAKVRVHGVIVNDKVKAYGFEHFTGGTVVIEDSFEGKDYVVVGDQNRDFIVSFERTIDGTVLSFTAEQGTSGTVLVDNEGNKWNVLGEAVEGSRIGQKLTPTTSFIGYWFAWAAFYENITLYQ